MSLSNKDTQRLNSISVDRVFADMKYLSTGVVNSPNGTGRGSAVAGTPEEHKMAKAIYQMMKEIGIEVKFEAFPVQTYSYDPVVFKVNNQSYPAVSLHAAGATYGTRYGLPFAIGNAHNKTTVIGELIDGGNGTLEDYEAIPGGVAGKVVVIRRNLWPTNEIIEAARRGALALLVYGYYEDGELQIRPDLLKQDAMYNHLQLPVASISVDTYLDFKARLEANEKLTVELKNRMDVADGTSYSVIGRIEGKKHPDEYIMVSAHYDRWFTAAFDNSSGVAALLELARFVKNGKRPDRTHIFIAVAAEENGIYDSTWDWLAGSYHIVNRYPKIFRNLVYALNLDIYGWTAESSRHQTSPDLIPFQKEVVALANTSLPVEVVEFNNSNVDAWVYERVGGCGIVFPTSRNSSIPKYNYYQYYHTDGDIFEPDRFQAMGPELRISAVGLLLSDRRQIVPLSFPSVIQHFIPALNSAIADNPDIDYSGVQEALTTFWTQVNRVDTLAQNACGDDCKATIVNRGLMTVRKEIMPWLYAISNWRINKYDRVFQRIKAVLAAAEANDRDATIAAILALAALGGGWWTVIMRFHALFSEGTIERERLYYYANSDWANAYEGKQELIGVDIDKIFFRLKRNETQPIDEVETIKKLVGHVYVLLTETLFITRGKLLEGAENLQRYVQ